MFPINDAFFGYPQFSGIPRHTAYPYIHHVTAMSSCIHHPPAVACHSQETCGMPCVRQEICRWRRKALMPGLSSPWGSRCPDRGLGGWCSKKRLHDMNKHIDGTWWKTVSWVLFLWLVGMVWYHHGANSSDGGPMAMFGWARHPPPEVISMQRPTSCCSVAWRLEDIPTEPSSFWKWTGSSWWDDQ